MTKEPQSIQHLDYSIFEIIRMYSQKCNTYYHRDFENSCGIFREQEGYPYCEFLAFDITNNSEITVGVLKATPSNVGLNYEKKFSCMLPKLKVTNNIMQIISSFKASNGNLETFKNTLEKICLERNI